MHFTTEAKRFAAKYQAKLQGQINVETTRLLVQDHARG